LNIVYKSFGPIEGIGDPIITPRLKIPLKLQSADFARDGGFYAVGV
jgi:hypothetical protein